MAVSAVELRPRLEPRDGSARTEIEVAADLLAHLMTRKLMRGDDQALAVIERVTGVPARAVLEAINYQKRFGYREPRAGRCEKIDDVDTAAGLVSPRLVEQHRRPPAKSDRTRRERSKPGFVAKNPTDRTRICSDCKDELPLIQFGIKSHNKDGTPRYHYRCVACRQKYGRKRYLSVQAEKTLGSLIEFVLGAEDIVGPCPYCPRPLEPGQPVAGVTRLAHAACLAAALNAEG